MKKTVLNSAVGLVLAVLAFPPYAEAVRVFDLLEERECPTIPSARRMQLEGAIVELCGNQAQLYRAHKDGLSQEIAKNYFRIVEMNREMHLTALFTPPSPEEQVNLRNLIETAKLAKLARGVDAEEREDERLFGEGASAMMPAAAARQLGSKSELDADGSTGVTLRFPCLGIGSTDSKADGARESREDKRRSDIQRQRQLARELGVSEQGDGPLSPSLEATEAELARRLEELAPAVTIGAVRDFTAEQADAVEALDEEEEASMAAEGEKYCPSSQWMLHRGADIYGKLTGAPLVEEVKNRIRAAKNRSRKPS